jgi:hypothetical protein
MAGLCDWLHTRSDDDAKGAAVSDVEQSGDGVELLLLEPEIVAWLDDYRPNPDDEGERDDDGPEPPWAA